MRGGCLFVLGFLILWAGQWLLAEWSQAYLWGDQSTRLDRPTPWVVVVLMGLSLCHFLWLHHLSKRVVTVSVVVVVFLLLRWPWLHTQPIQEDDFYRYLWDGAVLIQGENPYGLSPQDVIDKKSHVPEKISRRGEDLVLSDAGDARLKEDPSTQIKVLSRVNHPQLPTIYPPLAQIVFAAAAYIKEGSLLSLRLLFILAEFVGLLLCCHLLLRLNQPIAWALIPAALPLALKELVNSPHSEALLMPCLFYFVWTLVNKRPWQAALALALATAVKVIPFVLLPAMLVHCKRHHKAVLGPGVLYLGLVSLFFAPMLMVEDGLQSLTLLAGGSWNQNAFTFHVIHDVFGCDEFLSRMIMYFVFGCGVIATFPKRKQGDMPLLKWMTLTLVLLFYCSPTQNPWYWLWVMPLAVFSFPRAFMGVAAFLPLYYLRFHLGYTFGWEEGMRMFQLVVVPLESLGPALILGAAWLFQRKKSKEN